MFSFEQLRDTPEFQKLIKYAGVVVSVWIVALILFISSYILLDVNHSDMMEADNVLQVSGLIKSYPPREFKAGREPLAAISSMIDELKLKDKVGQLSSSQSGMIVEFRKIYSSDLARIVQAVSNYGLTVKTAEVKALASGNDGRLINLTLALEAGEK